ncbi:MAG: alanine racemase [Deltaproteobacteria bacterium]|nr:alanine racemase [Deltaproteobacteria bacterium]
MPIQYRPTTAEIDLNALRHNAREIRKRVPKERSIMAIVKANAYGHGALFCTRALEGCGIHDFGVATVEEGIELRGGGSRANIFVLGGLLTSSPDEFLRHRLRPVLHQLDEVRRFAVYLKETNRECQAHIKLDTGMGRLGIFPSEIEMLVSILKANPLLKVEGVLTHLARADETEPEPSERQFTIFCELKRILSEKGVNAPIFHIANSAAIIDERLNGFEMVRPGIILYGAYPHERHRTKINLKPVLMLKSRVISLKRFGPGSPISYGGTFVTKRESLIATLPIGYADGYPRLVSNKASVLVRGKRAPVVGRVCMDLTMVDVTDVPGATLGDEAVLIGLQGAEQIRACDLAQWADTISYEIFCGISSRVPRVYLGM